MTSTEEVFRAAVAAGLKRAPGRHAAYHEEFAANRFAEGAKALAYLVRKYPQAFERGSRILDVGGGNGGFLLPFAEHPSVSCTWLDRGHSAELEQTVRESHARIHRALGDAAALPFRSGSVDLVLYVETIEHVDARAVGREISRVLRPGGLCYITTPARMRFLFRRDPHYGVAGLAALPDAMQKQLFRLVRRGEPYEVIHLFWSARGIVGTLPGLRILEVTSRNWAGPLRRIDWDWIIARKE